MAGIALRLWEVRGWGAYQSPATPGQQMTFVKDYFHGAEGVFGSWSNGGIKRFFHNDHLGSQRLITGEDGANPVRPTPPSPPESNPAVTRPGGTQWRETMWRKVVGQ